MNTLNLTPRTYWDLVLITVTLICLLLNWLIDIPPIFEWIWVGSLMLLTGIPHGATDHLVHWYDTEQKKLQKSWMGFLLPYISQMVVYGLLWFIYPLLSFGLFLILTFYHFGQSELYYIHLSEKSILKKMVYITWGGGIMIMILLGNPHETIPYLEGILPETWLAPDKWEQVFLPLTTSLFTICFGLLTYFWVQQKMKTGDFIREIVVTLILGITLYYCNLWVSFGLYFGIWHSTKAIRAELELLNSQDQAWSLKQWILQALPFSLLSIFGLSLLLILWFFWGESIHLVFIFFVGVSMLTLPHMTTLEKLYGHLKKSTHHK